MALAQRSARGFVAAAALVLVLVGCGGGASGSPTATTAPTVAVAATSTVAASTTAAVSTQETATSTTVVATAAVTAVATAPAIAATTPPPTTAPAAASAGGDCPALTPADIKATTGVDVHAVPRLSQPGAGFTCANYDTADGKLFVGISLANSTGELQAMVPPDGVYPVKTTLSGVGDSATLYKTDAAGTVRFLLAGKGSKGFALAPFTTAITDDQLTRLAQTAAGRL